MPVLPLFFLAIALCVGQPDVKSCDAEKAKLLASELRILLRSSCGKCEIRERKDSPPVTTCPTSCRRVNGLHHCERKCKNLPWCPPKCKTIREQRRKVVLSRYSKACGGVQPSDQDPWNDELDDWQCERLPRDWKPTEEQAEMGLQFACWRPGGVTKLSKNNLEFGN